MEGAGRWFGPVSDGSTARTDFMRPPVTRAVVSVAFEPVQDLRAAHIGAHWVQINADGQYPQVVEFEAFPPHLESFEDAALGDVEVDVTYGDLVPVPRIVFGDEEGRKLAFQRDQFEVSWTRDPTGQDYPRHEVLLDEFRRHWLAWTESLARFGLSHPQVVQTGFTYFNRVERGSGWETAEDLEKLFRVPIMRARQGRLELWHYDEREVVIGDDGTRRRIHLHFLADGIESQVGAAWLTVTCRGRVGEADQSTDALIANLQTAHDYAVRTFVSATTAHAHRFWGRTDT